MAGKAKNLTREEVRQMDEWRKQEDLERDHWIRIQVKRVEKQTDWEEAA